MSRTHQTLLVLAAIAFVFLSGYTAVKVSTMSRHYKAVVQSISVTLPNGVCITTNRYEDESVDDWLALHAEAIRRAERK
jgi:4-hydroxybenzoate polyprenyltransferase